MTWISLRQSMRIEEREGLLRSDRATFSLFFWSFLSGLAFVAPLEFRTEVRFFAGIGLCFALARVLTIWSTRIRMVRIESSKKKYKFIDDEYAEQRRMTRISEQKCYEVEEGERANDSLKTEFVQLELYADGAVQHG